MHDSCWCPYSLLPYPSMSQHGLSLTYLLSFFISHTMMEGFHCYLKLSFIPLASTSPFTNLLLLPFSLLSTIAEVIIALSCREAGSVITHLCNLRATVSIWERAVTGPEALHTSSSSPLWLRSPSTSSALSPHPPTLSLLISLRAERVLQGSEIGNWSDCRRVILLPNHYQCSAQHINWKHRYP